MLGFFEGTADEKLAQVIQTFAMLAPCATCSLSPDRSEIICQGAEPDGTIYEERLLIELLPGESARHVAMRMAKVTQPAESIGDGERWASAWHAIQNRGAGALAWVDERIAQLTEDDDAAGVEVFKDLRRRVMVLRADPNAWPGRA